MLCEFITKLMYVEFCKITMFYYFSLNIILTIVTYSGITHCKDETTDDGSTVDSNMRVLHNDQALDEIWKTRALQDIAHYLRNHKFSEWDHRFYKNNSHHTPGFYAKFPEPKLRSLHWEVQENCYKDFCKCIAYLHKVIELAPFKRSDDITYLENSLGNANFLRKLNQKCKDALHYSENTGLPFDGPQERFIWRASASYFMCWYTIKETPDLALLGEPCDNFGSCLDPTFGKRNHDPRAQDKNTFSCALYSFCPDPCCPLKHISTFDECVKNSNNPCFNSDKTLNNMSICKVILKENQDFNDIIMNRWNVTCFTGNYTNAKIKL